MASTAALAWFCSLEDRHALLGDDLCSFLLARQGWSVNDSIAFLEAPVMSWSLGSDAPFNNVFDEEPFRSMLSDEIHYDEDDQPISSDQDSN